MVVRVELVPSTVELMMELDVTYDVTLKTPYNVDFSFK